MLIGQGKVDETVVGQKLDEPDEYDGEEQIVGGVDLEKDHQNNKPENTGVCLINSKVHYVYKVQIE